MNSQINECAKTNSLNLSKKVLALAIMVVGTSITVNAQSATSKTPAKEVKMGTQKKEHKKIEKKKLPKVVTETFIEEFPVVTEEVWYGYPKFNNEKDWYFNDPYMYEGENPEYYVVEFTKDNAKHKAVYTKAGKKVAVHKKTKEALPKVISEALKKSKYGTWKIANEKEVIFKDSEKDKIKTYRIVAENGKEKYDLYFSTEGNLLKEHKIK